MTKRSPFLLLTATIVMVCVALTAFWIALLPQRMVNQLAARMKSENGLVLEVQQPHLRFDGGMVLQLEGVTLADAANTTSLTAQALSIEAGFATLFSGAVTAEKLTLEAPRLTIDVSVGAKALSLPARQIFFRDGTVKLRDAARRSSLAVSDVNGSLTLDGAAKLDASFMQNGVLTSIAADAESADRMMALGSPADILVSAGDNNISFSGRARLDHGLVLDGQMSFEGKDTAQALRWIGIPLPLFEAAGAVSITSGFSNDGLSASFNGVSAKIGEAEFKGLANLQVGVDRAKFTGDLSVARLSLLAKDQVLARPWSEAAYQLRDFTAIDADVKLKADHLILRGHDWGAADVTLAMAAGKTEIGVVLPVGAMNLVMVPAADAVKLDVDMDVKAMDARILLSGVFGLDHVSGPADVKLKASAVGRSVAAWISTLSGQFSFASKSTAVAEVDFAGLLAGPQEGWKPDTKKATRNLAVAIEADLAEGVASLKKVEFTMLANTIKAKGEVDLLRQAFDISLAQKGSVRAVKGTWALPLFAAQAGLSPPLRAVAAPGN